MNDKVRISPEKILQEVTRIDLSGLPLDQFFLKIFSTFQKGVDFQSCWYFPVDYLSRQRTLNSLQIWDDTPPRLEVERILLDERCFPSVSELIEKEMTVLRGESWWSPAQLMRHPLYWKLLKDENLLYSFVGLLLDDREQCIGYLILWRIKDKGPFDETEFSLLSDLLPLVAGFLKKIAHDPKVFEKKTPTNRPPAQLLKPIQKVVGIDEAELNSFIRRRAQPGILILSQQGEILYSNHDARQFLEKLSQKPESVPATAFPGTVLNDKNGQVGNRSRPMLPLPEIVYDLYDQISKSGILVENEVEEAMPTENRICIQGGIVYLLRALRLHHHKEPSEHTDIMILVERASQGVRVDEISEKTKLTPREGEVVQLLLEGKTNKEVAVCIEIGEYTVKDHIKRIMKKLEVTTRAGIVAKVLQSHFPA